MILGWMVPVSDEPDAQILSALEPPGLVDVVADLFNVPRSGGDVAALTSCTILNENQVADVRYLESAPEHDSTASHIQHFAARFRWSAIHTRLVLLLLSI